MSRLKGIALLREWRGTKDGGRQVENQRRVVMIKVRGHVEDELSHVMY